MTWRRHHTRTLGETAAPSARLHARFHAVGHGHRVKLRADDDETAHADHRQPDVLSDVTRRDKSEPVPSADGGLTTVGLDMDVEDVGGMKSGPSRVNAPLRDLWFQGPEGTFSTSGKMTIQAPRLGFSDSIDFKMTGLSIEPRSSQ